MEKIRSFTTEDKQVSVPMETVVQGNVLVVVHHIRTVPVAKSAGMVGRQTDKRTCTDSTCN